MKARTLVALAFGGALLFAFGPLLIALAASSIGGALGCQVDEGGTHQCILLGADIGADLHDMTVLAWLGLVTLPTGLVVAACLGIALLLMVVLRDRT